MEKNWKYKGKEYTMKKLNGYGQYTLNGHHCTDSLIWDYIDDENNLKKQRLAKLCAEAFLMTIDF